LSRDVALQASEELLEHIDSPEGSVIAAFDLAQLGLRRFLVSYRWDSEGARNAVNIIWGEILHTGPRIERHLRDAKGERPALARYCPQPVVGQETPE
jgi:hypothetical protein